MLHFLDLSSVAMSMRLLNQFCEAVAKHPALHTLKLADTGLGNAINVKHCMSKVLSNHTLEVLDLGWNCFTAEAMSFLGECLLETKRIKYLGLANTAASSHKNNSISPTVYFLEHLMQNEHLTGLDISMNRIDFRGALVIEDALERCRSRSWILGLIEPLRAL